MGDVFCFHAYISNVFTLTFNSTTRKASVTTHHSKFSSAKSKINCLQSTTSNVATLREKVCGATLLLKWLQWFSVEGRSEFTAHNTRKSGDTHYGVMGFIGWHRWAKYEMSYQCYITGMHGVAKLIDIKNLWILCSGIKLCKWKP